VDAGAEPRKSIEAGGIRATIVLGFAGLAMLLLAALVFHCSCFLWRKGWLGQLFGPCGRHRLP
jgi:hypothetical protein